MEAASSQHPAWEQSSSGFTKADSSVSRLRQQSTRLRSFKVKNQFARRKKKTGAVQGKPKHSTNAETENPVQCDGKPNSSHEIDVFILNLDTEVLRIRFPLRSMSIRISDFLCLKEGGLLNDTIIDFYLNHIVAHLLPDDSALRYHVFPSLFWRRVKNLSINDNQAPSTEKHHLSSNAPGKLSEINYWLDEEDVFDADFLVLPVNYHQHWSLAVVCSPHLSIKSVDEINAADYFDAPIIVIFDSQQAVRAMYTNRIVTTIKKFLQLAFSRKANLTEEKSFHEESFKCVVPANLSQQQNNVDCGVYVVEYAKKFLMSPPSMESLQTGFFDFISAYPDFDVTRKRRDIQETILSLCADFETWSSLLNTVDVPFEYQNQILRIRDAL